MVTNNDGTKHTEPPELKPRSKHPWRYSLRDAPEISYTEKARTDFAAFLRFYQPTCQPAFRELHPGQLAVLQVLEDNDSIEAEHHYVGADEPMGPCQLGDLPLCESELERREWDRLQRRIKALDA